ncbi:MAG: hypothetical protein ACJAW7_002904 [Candidatus Azotimanducaceae bacterium]
MNWEVIGAVAELAGSVGVILTLVYVATQIKQANVGMRVSAKQEMSRQYGEFADQIIEDVDLAELFLAGNEGEELDRIQRLRYFTMMEKATWQFASMYFQQQHQALPAEEWHQTKVLIQRTCISVGYRKWWSINRPRYELDFVAFIDNLLSRADT